MYGVNWLSTFAGQQTAASLKGFITAPLVRFQFDNLSAKERFVILVVVESHERFFPYSPGGKTIQSLIDKGWVDYDHSVNYETAKFAIRWDKWLALENFRAHVRSEWERFSDDDKEKMGGVRAELKRVGML